MKGANWLVTGATGFLGRHVAREIAASGVGRAIGISRKASCPQTGIDEFVTIDPFSVAAWEAVLQRFEPAVVVHLAGRTPPADHATLVRDNVDLTGTLVTALRRAGRPVRLIHCGSAAELGDLPAAMLPANELTRPEPVIDYGRTKLSATQIVLGAKGPVVPVVGRVFNLFGPGQPPGQVFGRYARAFRELGRNRTEPWLVAGLTARRDFIDVRDAARALIALGRHCAAAGLYHIGTGHSRSIGEGLAILSRLAGCQAPIVEDPVAPRHGPADSFADIGRITAETFWRPEIAFQSSLEDLWNEAGGPLQT